MNIQPDNRPGYTPDFIATRWLRERDEARDHGDHLAGAVSAYLRGDVTADNLTEALNKHDNPRFWILETKPSPPT